MKQKKPSSLTRILGYAGGHKNLTILGCILSALSAVLGLAPYLCVWLVARSILAAWPSLDGGGDLGRFGWMAVWFAVGSILLYFAALMSTHIAAFRTARNIRRAAMAHVLKLPLGFFTGNQSGRLRKLIDDNAGLTEDLLAHKLPDLAATAVTPIAAIVAHRMRTVAGADHIVVLEDGHVAQQGAPAELMEQGGLYRRMVELQRESAQWRLGS